MRVLLQHSVQLRSLNAVLKLEARRNLVQLFTRLSTKMVCPLVDQILRDQGIACKPRYPPLQRPMWPWEQTVYEKVQLLRRSFEAPEVLTVLNVDVVDDEPFQWLVNGADFRLRVIRTPLINDQPLLFSEQVLHQTHIRRLRAEVNHSYRVTKSEAKRTSELDAPWKPISLYNQIDQPT